MLKEFCKLCLKDTLPIENSHILAAGFYRTLKGQDQAVTLVSEDKTFTTSAEIRTKLLCRECEEKFSTKENYVIKNCFQADGTFPIRDKISKTEAICSIPSGTAHNGSQIPDLLNEYLAYFAISVFWRASVTDWIYEKRKLQRSHLGEKYEEEYRKYLDGTGVFPSNTYINVLVSNSSKPPRLLHVPFGSRQDGFHVHRFMVPGIQFLLLIGKLVPKEGVDACIYNSKHKTIFLASWPDEAAAKDLMGLMKYSQLSKKLQLKHTSNLK